MHAFDYVDLCNKYIAGALLVKIKEKNHNPQACAHEPTQIKILNDCSSDNEPRKMNAVSQFLVID